MDHIEHVLNYMLTNGIMLMGFLLTVLTSTWFSNQLWDIQFDILSPKHSTVVLRNWILNSAQAIYMEEIQMLMEKEVGLHMNASKLHPAQLEEGRISALGPLFASKAPALWGLCQWLLKVESNIWVRCHAPLSAEKVGRRHEGSGGGDHVSAGQQSKGNSAEWNYALLQIVSYCMVDKHVGWLTLQ